MLDRPALRWLRLHPVGLAVGTAFAMLAMTPSLIPRGWMFQGVVCGISAAAGYGVGVSLAWLVRRFDRWRRLSESVRSHLPRSAIHGAWPVLLLGVLVALSTMLVVAAGWQRELAGLMGMDQTTTSGWLRVGPVLVVVALLLLLVARAIRWFARLLARALRRWLRFPGWAAGTVGALLAALVVVTLVNDVVLRRVLSAADTTFSGLNRSTYPGVAPPQSPTRSGSPASLVSWQSLGREGRSFVAGGRPPHQLGEAGKRAPVDPIRVYVGLDAAASTRERADLAVAELERTRAVDRSALVVVTTTGTGWTNAGALESLELMYGGDTAMVAIQYSYLPSWLSFLVDRSRAAEAGRVLFDAVHAKVAALPQHRRPRLFVYGESLGSQGSEAAFATLADIRARTDGVLWVGPPNSNRLWRELVERRSPGSTEIEPVYASGLVVRFAGDAADITRPATPWLAPRVLYLQHPSDPIVWWSPRLLFDRPDWLTEPRGADVSPAMSWHPVVTFWQLTADMANSQSVPDGHGHNYGDLVLDGWVAVAAPHGWTDADTARVRAILAA